MYYVSIKRANGDWEILGQYDEELATELITVLQKAMVPCGADLIEDAVAKN